LTVGSARVRLGGGTSGGRLANGNEESAKGLLDLASGLQAFVDGNDDAAELLWRAAMVTLERAAREAQEVSFPSRWQTYPSWGLRRVRRQIASALQLARAAVETQERFNELQDELYRDLRAEAQRTAARQRGEGTLSAEYGRVARARARAAGVTLGSFEPDEVLERWAGPREEYYRDARARRASR
jgi:hypothetical protein